MFKILEREIMNKLQMMDYYFLHRGYYYAYIPFYSYYNNNIPI